MAKAEINPYQFPWRGGNHFQLRVDGDSFFPAMLNAIHQAQQFIALEMYLVESGNVLDAFIDALLQAAGHDVKIYLLLDDFGSHGMKKQDRLRLQHANIKLCFYNPLCYGRLRRMLFRDHRKLLLVDNHTAFIGGAGLTDAFDPSSSQQDYWHDLMLEIKGPCVADWTQLFIENWPGDNTDFGFFKRLNNASRASNQEQLGRVTITQAGNRQEIKASLIKRIKNAEHHAWIATAYFVPSWKIRRALRHAARRGVDVRLILPGPHTDHPAIRHAGRRYYYSLLKHGVRIFEYQPRFSHYKAYLCDQWSSIGSSNLDRWNFLWNLEGNQEIDDQHFVTELRYVLEKDMTDSTEIDYKRWQQRPWQWRLLEWFWGRIDLWLHRTALRWQNRQN